MLYYHDLISLVNLLLVNRVPIPNYCTASTTMDYGVLVPVTACDPDGNGMLIYVDALPSLGLVLKIIIISLNCFLI